jgi:hypothetical protein
MRRNYGVRLAILAVGVWAAGTIGVADDGEKSLTGNWTYFVGPRPADGRLATLQLKQEGDKLTGKVVLPGGMTQDIHEGKVEGKHLSFVVQLRNGAKVHHAGDVAGDMIKGKTEFEPPGKPKRPHLDWEARPAAD